MDDIFTFIKQDEIENVKNVLNGFHSRIKFTMEKNDSIAFLDVKISKRPNGVFNLHWKLYCLRAERCL